MSDNGFEFDDTIEEHDNVQNNPESNHDGADMPSKVSRNDSSATEESAEPHQRAPVEEETLTAENETDETNENKEESQDKKASLADISDVKKNKAPMLNRGLILSISVGLLLLIFLFVFIGGGKPKPKKNTEEISNAGRVYVPDFDAMAKNNLDTATDGETAPDIDADTAFINDIDDHHENEISTKTIDAKIMQNANNIGTAPVETTANVGGNGGGTAKKKPDTRANVMQKNISGIKGLTKVSTSQNQNTEQGLAADPYAFLTNGQADLAQRLLQSQGLTGASLMNNQTQTQNEQAFYENNFGGNNQGEFLPSLSLWQGTIVPAVLLTAIDTGLPGSIVARVTRNVYSSLDGKFLLIPQGTLLFAEYNSSVGYAQKRVQIGWTAMIRPDGYYISLSNMPAIDNQGYTGITGKINTHFWEFIKGLFLVSAISVLDTDINQSAETFTDPYSQNVIGNLQGTYKSINDKIIDKALNIEPSINVQSGREINILVNKTLFLPPVPVPEVSNKYVRRK